MIIFALAIYLRIDAYLINNSFFTDEILLAQNIFERNYLCLFLSLNYFQSAPYLFLALSKFVSNFGINELCFRFIPFLSSLISVYLFYLLSKEIFQTRLARAAALFTFGISYQLLFYAQVFKQYSSDVCISILILLISSKVLKKELSLKQWLGLGVVWAFCVLFSYPAYITIAAFYLTVCICCKCKDKILLSLVPAGLCTLAYGVLNLGKTHSSAYLSEYWKKGFEIFSIEIYKINFDFLFQYYSFPLLLLFLLIAGFCYLYKRNRFCFVQIFSVFTLTLLAAYLKLYPFERRLALFLLPFLIIVSIYPLDNLKKEWKSFVCVLISVLFFAGGYFNFVKEFTSGNVSYLRQDVKPLLAIVTMKSDEAPLYLYYGSLTAYSYYSRIYNLPEAIAGTYPDNEKFSEKYLLTDLENLKRGTYYLLFVKGTWTYDKDINTFKEWVDKNSVLLDEYNLKSAYLAKISEK